MELTLIKNTSMNNALYHSSIVINGQETTLSKYQDQALLLVNTATECGLSKQFEGLELLHKRYGENGLKVIGFPCNQFRNQEPLATEEIPKQCALRFGVSFDLSEKIDVNGINAHPIFKELTESAPGILGSKSIKWNFTKFLIAPQGINIERFSPTHSPEKLGSSIESMLKEIA